MSLSASTLKLYLECPRCFWLHLNKRIERPRGPFPSLPSGMDRVLKGYFETYRKTAYVIYYDPLDGALHDGFPFGIAIHEVATDPAAAYEVFRAARRVSADPLPPSSDVCTCCRWLKARQTH